MRRTILCLAATASVGVGLTTVALGTATVAGAAPAYRTAKAPIRPLPTTPSARAGQPLVTPGPKQLPQENTDVQQAMLDGP
jgi:hypothetical protein